MTKLQTWNKAQQIITELGLTKKNEKIALEAFELLLAPKKGGGSRPEPKQHNGEAHYYCRFTTLYFPTSEMVYQNDEARTNLKDKGYSNIGISLWNKGQKYLKDLQKRSIDIAYGKDQIDETRAKGMALHQEAQALIDANSMNDGKYLLEHFLTTEQADVLEGLDLPGADTFVAGTTIVIESGDKPQRG